MKRRTLAPCESAAQRIRRLLPMTLDDWARMKDHFPGLNFTLSLADPDERPQGRLILNIEEKSVDEPRSE